MTPSELKPEQFREYPPQARQIAAARIAELRQMPLGFLPLLLRELIAYDWKFPAERNELEHQFAYLSAMSPQQLKREMSPFEKLRLSPQLEQVDWVNRPAQFSEKLASHLWATHQMDAFRSASVGYVHKLNAAAPQETLPIARLGVAMIGQGVTESRYPLFRKLRPHGVYFTNVKPANGKQILFDAVAARAKAQPIPFGHWYIEGGESETACAGLTSVSYQSLARVRTALLAKMRGMTQAGSGGPEALRTTLAQMQPDDIGLSGTGAQAVLNRFAVSVLAEGSGTQIFSTTFVQWSAREALRRAQPVTLLTRYAPRQQEQSMEKLLAGTQHNAVPDAAGSLVDADMGAYYTWINQQRLTGAHQASFLVWFEGHNQALAIGPSLKPGSEDGIGLSIEELLRRLT